MPEEVELYYETIGDGFPLVLIHGWSADGLSYLFQIPLAYHYRLILPDLRGHGKSPKPQTEYTAEILASDVNRLLEKLAVEKAIICGGSLGGKVALQFALDYPEKVEALILVNTASTSSGLQQLFDGCISVLSAPNPVEMLSGMISSMPGLDEVFIKSPVGSMFMQSSLERLEQIEPKSFLEVTKGMERFDVTDRLSEIKAPTLIIAGEKDSILPPSLSEEMYKRIAGSEYVTISTEHGTPFARPDEFNRVVRNYLKKIGY
jgi:3-oxoadipate enol-lactonase